MIMYKTVRNILEAILTSGSFKQLGIDQGIVEARGGTQFALCFGVEISFHWSVHALGKVGVHEWKSSLTLGCHD